MSLRTFAGSVIDVGALPAPVAIKSLDYEAGRAERMARLKAIFAERGVDYDVGTLETDPGAILQQVDMERELLDKAAINDAVRAVLPAFSRGTDLENIVARANVQRLEVTPADTITGAAAVMEEDTALLRRYLAGFAAPSAGSEDGYYFHAASAAPGLWDVAVLDYTVHGTPGRIEIVLLAPEGGAVPAAAIDAVRYAFAKRKTQRNRPASDDVIVRAGTVVRYRLVAKLRLPKGPDPERVLAVAREAVKAWALERYFLGGEVPANGPGAGLAINSNVIRADVAEPTADIPPAPDAAPWLADEDLVLTYEIVG